MRSQGEFTSRTIAAARQTGWRFRAMMPSRLTIALSVVKIKTVDRCAPGSPVGSRFEEAITWHPPEMGHEFRLGCRELFDGTWDRAAGSSER